MSLVSWFSAAPLCDQKKRFEFINKPEPSLRQVYDMIMASQAVLGESLFESGFRQRLATHWAGSRAEARSWSC